MASSPVYHVDANVLLRFLRNDHAEHSPRAARLIERANEGHVILEISAVTVAEVFYALRASYRVDRRRAASALADLLNTPAFRLAERALVLDSLARVQASNVDFGDAYLAATAAESGHAVASFDRDLDKFADVKRFEP
jgi:predicted nucleic acid-binding protein